MKSGLQANAEHWASFVSEDAVLSNHMKPQCVWKVTVVPLVADSNNCAHLHCAPAILVAAGVMQALHVTAVEGAHGTAVKCCDPRS